MLGPRSNGAKERSPARELSLIPFLLIGRTQRLRKGFRADGEPTRRSLQRRSPTARENGNYFQGLKYSGLPLIPCDAPVKARGRAQRGEQHMPQSEKFEVLVLGSGIGGKLIAWHMAQSGHRTAVVERRWVGGSCPNIACMPSKNEISSAKVAHVARHGREYGAVTGSVTVDMATVRQRKRAMVERQVAKHLKIYRASGAELIMGSGRFIAPKTLEVN